MHVIAEKHFSLDKGINAEMMVLGITAQPLLVLVRAWSSYHPKVNTLTYL